jgi:PKD repeat protein
VAPVAAFSGTPTSGDAPLTVQFTDASTNTPTSWAWDFDDDGDTDSTDQHPSCTYGEAGTYAVNLSVTNAAGSDDETKTNYITVTAAPIPADLTVTDIWPNENGGDYLFANEPNRINLYIDNIGAGDAGASTAALTIGGTVTTVAVDPISAGGSIVVTITDSISHTANEDTAVSAIADYADAIAESDETNNEMTLDTANDGVFNNGFKGKRWTAGSDLSTQAGPFEGRLDVLYSAGNSQYNNAGWTEKTYAWSSTDLPVPTGATVTSARLYQGYTWDQTPGGSPLWTMTFNGATVAPIATHTDRKGYGIYNYPQGLYVYDVTSRFLAAGNSMTITPQEGNDNGIYGAYLIVVYEDRAGESLKKIWINDGCDSLFAGTARSVSSEEATAYAIFGGVSTAELASARAIAILQSAGEPGMSRFFFNSNEYTGFWSSYLSGPQVGFSSYDVTGALTSGDNMARLQSYDSGSGGDNIYVTGTILIVEKAETTVPPTTAVPLTSTETPTSTSTTTTLTVTPSPTVTPNVTPSSPDLVVTSIGPNAGAGAVLFANEPNILSVTVKNQGTGDAGASTLSLIAGADAFTTSVPALAANTSTTVNITDPVIYTAGRTLNMVAYADNANTVVESDEANNTYSQAFPVYNNGYKGKRWTGGSDLSTRAGPFTGRIDVLHSAGSSGYSGANWTPKTCAWAAADLPVPAGATVMSARLYQGYTYNKMGVDPAWTLIFNGDTVSPVATYRDTKGFGTYDFPYGLAVYDVTDRFDTAGNSMTIAPEPGNNYGIYGAYLIVVYRDEAGATEKTIWVNDEFDMLQSQAAYSVSSDEATAYASFVGVDTTGMSGARAIAVLASAADTDKSRFFFNDHEYTGFWSSYLSGPQVGFSSYDVMGALTSGDNTARLQSYDPGTKGDNLYAMNTILVMERAGTTVTPTPTVTVSPTVTEDGSGPIAHFTASTYTGSTPLYVRFTDASQNADDYFWQFGDGAYSFQKNPTRIYRATGNYTVNLTVWNTSGHSDSMSATITATGIAVPTTTPTVTVTATVTATPTVIGVNQPYPSAHLLPGKVEAEDYDTTEGYPAYSDTTPGNEGGAYRNDAVDIEVGGSGYNVGWIRAGEFLTYSVDVPAGAGGQYLVSFGMANPGGTKSFPVSVDGQPVGTVTLLGTGSFTTWTSVAGPTFPMAEGRHVITVAFPAVSSINFDSMTFTTGSIPVETTPTTTITQSSPATFTAAPNPVNKNALVRFGLNPASGKTIRSVWWTFDKNKHFGTWNSRNVNPAFFYPSAGTFTPLVKIAYTDGSTEQVEREGYIIVG